MKKRKIILILLLLSVILISVFYLLNKSSSTHKKFDKITQSEYKIDLENRDTLLETKIPESKFYSFIIEPVFEKEIYFNVSGNLDYYKWTSKSTFKKNDLLFSVNNEKLFKKITANKERLKNLIENKISTLADESEKIKWRTFLIQVQDVELLPEKPEFITFESKNDSINKLIKTIHEQEKSIFEYFYLAPLDGKFKILPQQKQYISKRKTFATIIPSKKAKISGIIHRKDLTLIEKSSIGKNPLKFKKEPFHSDSLRIELLILKSKLKSLEFYDTLKISK